MVLTILGQDSSVRRNRFRFPPWASVPPWLLRISLVRNTSSYDRSYIYQISDAMYNHWSLLVGPSQHYDIPPYITVYIPPSSGQVYSLILADNGICCNFKSELQSNVGEGGQKQLHDPVLLSGHSRSAIYAQHWVSTKWHVGSTPSVILETNRFRPNTYGTY